MIDRLIPIFAVLGILSAIFYLALMAWAAYRKLTQHRSMH